MNAFGTNDQRTQSEPRSSSDGMLFDMTPAWVDHWRGMPSYSHKDLQAQRQIVLNFRTAEDRRDFAKLIGQTVTPSTRSIWYPEAEIARYADKYYRSDQGLIPRYPVYIISKGRWETRLTSKALEELGTPYYIVVEPQEFDAYSSVIAPTKILKLPFQNLGEGSIPARNWVWEHALASGVGRHWILDDNIKGFFRYEYNLKCPVADATIFAAAEDFVDRYTNIALSGFHYFMFVSRKTGNIPPFYRNTRVYSCILIQNDIPYRWRGRYNEDTDLSIRALKDGWCTILFNAFLADKQQTMTMKGGNTDELYAGDGRLKMAESLREQHPDVVEITEKWGHPQHHVNYKPFRKNKLQLKPGVEIPDGPNDYGMELFERKPNRERQR